MSYETNVERQNHTDASTRTFQFHSTNEEIRALSASSSERRLQSSLDFVGAGHLPNLQFTGSDPSTVSSTDRSKDVVFAYPTTQIGDRFLKTGIDVETNTKSVELTTKLHDFVSSAYRNAINPNNYQNYFESEKNKFVGIGQGLNIAKESTKHAAGDAWTAMTDGTVLTALSKSNAINDPLFKGAGDSFNACASDSNAVNKLLGRGLQATFDASEKYSNLPDVQKGELIGQAMFGLINADGSLRAATDGLRIADHVATHVDATVMQALKNAADAADVLKEATPELVHQTKQLLQEFAAAKGLKNAEFAYAGIGRASDGAQVPLKEIDNTFAMSSSESVLGYSGNPRLRRTDLGKPRLPYEWQALGEQFSERTIRQTDMNSCISAVGEMLTNGQFKESFLIKELGPRPGIDQLAKTLGDEWTTKRGPATFQEICATGPWGADFLPTPNTGHSDMPHTVVVDGISKNGNLQIRDPWEGTEYEMSNAEFRKHWSQRCIYKTK